MKMRYTFYTYRHHGNYDTEFQVKSLTSLSDDILEIQ